jgi:hypothetical protein
MLHVLPRPYRFYPFTAFTHLPRASVMGCYYCSDGIMPASLDVGPGLTLANYVRTKNLSYPVGSVAHFREEW